MFLRPIHIIIGLLHVFMSYISHNRPVTCFYVLCIIQKVCSKFLHPIYYTIGLLHVLTPYIYYVIGL